MTHTLEILVMLGVALLLGGLLYHLATVRRRRQMRELRAELDRLQALEASLGQRLETAEKNLADAREDLAATARVLAERPENEAAPAPLLESLEALRAQQSTMSEEVRALRRQVENVALPVARI